MRRQGSGGGYPRASLFELSLGQIYAARMKRLTPDQSTAREPDAASQAMFLDGEPGVLRAGRRETARTRQKRRDSALVETERGDRQALHREPPRDAVPRQSRTRSSTKIRGSALAASGFRCTTRSREESSPRPGQRRYVSRIRLFK